MGSCAGKDPSLRAKTNTYPPPFVVAELCYAPAAVVCVLLLCVLWLLVFSRLVCVRLCWM